MKSFKTKSLAFTAILISFGILIPLIMPVKIVIGPASFTLASHLPIFLAMFISMPVAIMVALGTALGFLFAGFPIIIVLRALSHILFAVIGAVMVQQSSKWLEKPIKTLLLALFLNLLHGLAEFFIVYELTVTSSTSLNYLWSLLLLVGLGSLIHGTMDFYLAYYLKTVLAEKAGIDFALKK